MCTRETLSELIEGRLSAPGACSELVRLATRLIIEETLEAESRDVLGRGYYEHSGITGLVRMHQAGQSSGQPGLFYLRHD